MYSLQLLLFLQKIIKVLVELSGTIHQRLYKTY